MSSERRVFTRVPDDFFVMYRVEVPFAVHIQLGSRDLDAFAQDISEGGLGIVTEEAIFANSQILMKFSLLENGKGKPHAFELEGQVQHHRHEPPQKKYRLGVRFLSISEKDRDFIARYIKSKSLKPVSR